MSQTTQSSADLLDSRYSWFRLGIALAISMVGSAGMWAIILVLPRMQADLGVGRGEVSFAYTTTMVGFALGNVFLGRLVDRYGITPVLMGSALLNALGFALISQTETMWLISLFQGLLVGLGASSCFGPLIADTSHWFKRRRGVAVSIVASGNYFAGAVWPILLAPVLAEGGWRAGYLVIAIAIAVIVLPLAVFLRRSPPDHSTTANATGAAYTISLSPRSLQILLSLAGLGCCVAMAMPQVHIVALCADLGYGPAVGGEMLSLMLFGGIVSRVVSGMLADVIGGVRTLLLGSTLQCLALFLYLPFDGLTSLYIVSLVFGLSQGGIVPSYAVIVREYLPAKEAGERIGQVVMATVAGMALGGWLSGVIYDWTGSYDLAFLNGIAWNIMNMSIAVLILLRTVPPRPQTA